MSVYLIVGDTKFDYLARLVSARFLHYKVVILAFVLNKYLWRDSSKLCHYFVFHYTVTQ